MKNLRAFNAEGEKIYTTENKWQRLKEQIARHVQRVSWRPSARAGNGHGGAARQARLHALARRSFRVVVDTLIQEKTIAKEENLLRLRSHRVQLGGQEKTLMDKIKKILGEQPMAPPDLKEIEKQAGVHAHQV